MQWNMVFQVHMLDFLLPILLWQWMSTRTQILVRVSTIRHLSLQKDTAVPVVAEADDLDANGVPIFNTGMHKIVVIAKLSKFDTLKKAMNDLGVTGMTVTQVMGCGVQKGAGEYYRGVEMDATLLPKIKVEIIVSKIPVTTVIEAAKKALYTGHIGDGKIFVYNVLKVVKVRTGEEDYAALQDVE